jgi:uncharacterized protein YcbK (DUF882 family)/type II secretory pathway pseudopilin PulG
MTTNAALLPRAQRRHRVYRGLTERQEYIFNWVAIVVILLMMTAWTGAIIDARRQQQEDAREQAAAAAAAGAAGAAITAPAAPPAPSSAITSALTNQPPTTAPFMTDALMKLAGESHKLFFATRQPGAPLAPGVPQAAPANPGMYKLASQINQATNALANFNLFTLVPLEKKQQGKIGLYYLGTWPFEKGGKPKTPAYATPSGFIEVTPQNQNTYISEHFRLRDFLTHNQTDVWPKYIPLNPNLVDKLELTIEELQAQGIRVNHMTIMSGFRTPSYNAGGGNTEGRANLSRHMYGDASDVFIDNDGNGTMDDLNHDGRVDTRDADIVSRAAERVEQKHPSLVGGIGVYSACCGHGPFIHIDVRGYRARWRGFGNG